MEATVSAEITADIFLISGHGLTFTFNKLFSMCCFVFCKGFSLDFLFSVLISSCFRCGREIHNVPNENFQRELNFRENTFASYS